jgi:FkbM family methyltransferase
VEVAEQLVLFGAGAVGRDTLVALRARNIVPVCVVDNNPQRWGTPFDSLVIASPEAAAKQWPEAEWIVSIHRRVAREVRQQLREMRVNLVSEEKYLPFCRPLPARVMETLRFICGEPATLTELTEQETFRRTLDLDTQADPCPPEETYFPPFLAKRTDEVFLDCGACDGDSVEAFIRWSGAYKSVLAFEPDRANAEKLKQNLRRVHGLETYPLGISDHHGEERFNAVGAVTSSFSESGDVVIEVTTLDSFFKDRERPTFIKMDIEGAELTALWGARRLIKQQMPVLAVCAYHEPDHLWEIPFLIHAIQPDYELRLRRYAEGTRELVWYAVPKNRILAT